MGKTIKCPDCKGSGWISSYEECGMCQGTGLKEITDDWGVKRKVRCLPCKGTGKIEDEDTCSMCGGAGEIEV